MHINTPGEKSRDFEAVLRATGLPSANITSGSVITLSVWVSKKIRMIGVCEKNFPALFAAFPDLIFDPDDSCLKRKIHVGGRKGLHREKRSLAQCLRIAGIPTIIQ